MCVWGFEDDRVVGILWISVCSFAQTEPMCERALWGFVKILRS